MKKTATKRLWISVGITAFILILELAGGVLSNSLSLLSDAGHVFTDLAASSLILLSIWWATKPPTPQNTYGYYRVEILATTINGALLLFIALQILWEAAVRLLHPQPIQLAVMLPVAIAGLTANGISAFLLHQDRDHLATRSVSSVGVVLGAVLILWTGRLWIDAAVALGIAGLILFGGYHLLKESVSILMEASPAHILLEDVEKTIRSVSGVESVHDLHVWTISSGYLAASAHIEIRPMETREGDTIVRQVSDRLKQEFGISHPTLQLETIEKR
jgi:cobalt-zinc-cadmium efflux system protein